MTTQEQKQHATSIHPGTQVGALSLTVGDLERSLNFYTNAIGFAVLERGDGGAVLGAGGAPLLHLHEQAGAEPFPTRATGLYHFAILLPHRRDLGRWLRHWFDMGLPMVGQGDHFVSEALYLSDPDGNGIEIYQDRAREGWEYASGQVRMTTGPVDVKGLLEDAERDPQPWTGLPAGTRIGHMHLQVADLKEAESFYHDALGFDIMASMPSALFVSAGGYHHHIGMNTWNSLGASPAPEGTAGLRHFTIEFPSEEARAQVLERLRSRGISYKEEGDLVTVQDPWGHLIRMEVVPST
jgi:catechol 2,3-dioxygenase